LNCKKVLNKNDYLDRIFSFFQQEFSELTEFIFEHSFSAKAMKAAEPSELPLIGH